MFIFLILATSKKAKESAVPVAALSDGSVLVNVSVSRRRGGVG